MQPRPFSPFLVPSSAKSPEEAFDANGFDFATYLGCRLGVNATIASDLLGQWVKTYQPAKRRNSRGNVGPAVQDTELASGARASTAAFPDALRTGTGR